AGIPAAIDQAVAAIAGGHVTALDVAEMNGRTFVNNASLGIYPRIVWEREAQRRRGRHKWTAFAIAAFRALRQYRTLTARLLVEGRELLVRTPFVFVGNGTYQVEGLGLGGRQSLTSRQLSIHV